MFSPEINRRRVYKQGVAFPQKSLVGCPYFCFSLNLCVPKVHSHSALRPQWTHTNSLFVETATWILLPRTYVWAPSFNFWPSLLQSYTQLTNLWRGHYQFTSKPAEGIDCIPVHTTHTKFAMEYNVPCPRRIMFSQSPHRQGDNIVQSYTVALQHWSRFMQTRIDSEDLHPYKLGL